MCDCRRATILDVTGCSCNPGCEYHASGIIRHVCDIFFGYVIIVIQRNRADLLKLISSQVNIY